MLLLILPSFNSTCPWRLGLPGRDASAAHVTSAQRCLLRTAVEATPAEKPCLVSVMLSGRCAEGLYLFIICLFIFGEARTVLEFTL